MQDLDPSDICKKKILNPLKRIRVIIRTPTHGRTDGRTDRQTDGRTNTLNFVSGGIKMRWIFNRIGAVKYQKSALVHVIAWRRTCDKPLPEPILTQYFAVHYSSWFIHTICRHSIRCAIITRTIKFKINHSDDNKQKCLFCWWYIVLNNQLLFLWCIIIITTNLVIRNNAYHG